MVASPRPPVQPHVRAALLAAAALQLRCPLLTPSPPPLHPLPSAGSLVVDTKAVGTKAPHAGAPPSNRLLCVCCRRVFLGWEGVEAQQKGVELNVFRPEDYGGSCAISSLLGLGLQGITKQTKRGSLSALRLPVHGSGPDSGPTFLEWVLGWAGLAGLECKQHLAAEVPDCGGVKRRLCVKGGASACTTSNGCTRP